MQPILMLAIAGVAIGALGTGFLNNTINLTDMVQDFGVGEATIDTPATNAYIDFGIKALPGQLNIDGEEVKVFKNVIHECIVQANAQLLPGSKVFCKLTDINDNVAIEGIVTLSSTVATNGLITVPILDTNPSAGKPANSVDNIHDVILVIQGPTALAPVP